MARRKAAATRKKGATQAKSRARRTARKNAARKKTAAVARARKASRGKAGKVSRAAKVSRTAKASRAAKVTRAGKASGGRQASKTRRPSTASRTAAARHASRAKRTVMLRKPPGLDRERRTIQDDDIVPTPPSSLDLDRTASAARTGRRELRERLDQHTETSPALTAGDVDADWESAYSVGDEAPGGDNPTPDQDVVDDIGRAVGVQYDDNEELKGEAKISKRDKHRWELDPASAEDFNEH
jgi:Family of unknown function (DUF6335)